VQVIACSNNWYQSHVSARRGAGGGAKLQTRSQGGPVHRSQEGKVAEVVEDEYVGREGSYGEGVQPGDREPNLADVDTYQLSGVGITHPMQPRGNVSLGRDQQGQS